MSSPDREGPADRGGPAQEARPGRALIDRIARHTPPEPRYEVKREIAHGGMGSILEVWEGDLRRKLAMKVIRAREGQAAGSGARAAGSQAAGAQTPAVDPAVLHRFLEEAQVTAQLSHPGVVPVHDLGVDRQGRVFFTMPLVQGHDLEHVFGLLRKGEAGWTQTRALGLLLKVCETMAYAHSQGVIHRDLKPANIMVGAFGEVYVMDWGLAKIAGQADPHDLRLASEAGASDPAAAVKGDLVSTDRHDLDAGSSLLTMDGTVVGTPSFMSPEQAQGRDLDARSDVYAMGAILYALLAGKAPYLPARGQASPVQIVLSIQKGPPMALAKLAPDATPELVAICEKAMSREPARRYPDVQELAEDLRAFLEGRVVRAYRTGAWAEFKKWVGRNKGMAASLAGAVLAVIGGVGAYAVRTKAARDLEHDKNLRITGLKDVKKVRALEEGQESLWPPLPAKATGLKRWVEEAQALQLRTDYHRESRSQFAAGTSEEDVFLTESLGELITKLEALPALTQNVAARRDFAFAVQERTVDGAEAAARWKAAADEIAKLPIYRGLKIKPQLGLLPLEQDPQSGLWEFWHLQSGDTRERDPDTGRWKIGERTGIVLVLVPGGAATIGSKRIKPPEGAKPESWAQAYEMARQSEDYGQPYFDPGREGDERFVEGVALDPFFFSKYETTQTQWSRLTGANPSRHFDEASLGGLTHPVETFSWYSARQAAERLALVLPTEAQWEYGCRAGTTTPFSSGEVFESLTGFANVADKTFHDGGQPGNSTEEVVDGWVGHAPVGTFEPNPFGLFDMHGNVWEWCLDAFNSTAPPRAGDGLREETPKAVEGAIRGGSFSADARNARSANRFNFDRNNTDSDVGVRFARALER